MRARVCACASIGNLIKAIASNKISFYMKVPQTN